MEDGGMLLLECDRRHESEEGVYGEGGMEKGGGGDMDI